MDEWYASKEASDLRELTNATLLVVVLPLSDGISLASTKSSS
jgi:hypothetical protein